MTAPVPLLDAQFVRELEALRRRLEIRARSGGAGEHVAKRRGGSAEFQEHRQYVAGDDLRRIDWLAYARTGEPVIKLFRAEEDMVMRLLIDASASLDFGEPSKIEVAKRLAAALGYMALAGSQRAQVLVAGGGDSSGTLARVSSPRRGRRALPALLRELDQTDAGGAVDLSRAVVHAMRQSRRPGMLVVISDFFDSGPLLQALAQARSAGNDIFLVQVVAREEVEPDFEGDFSLVDSETGETVEVTMDASAVDAYVMRFAGLIEELRGWARRHGATYVRAVNDEPLEDVVRRCVGRTVD